MSKYTIEFNNVWKKFRRGEHFDSLRDLIPAMVKRIFNLNGARPKLKKNEFWALKDVSFKVKRGEVLGIIGPNGAGKSTILKTISRILRPDKGEVITRGRLSALIELGAGFHPDLTGRENIYLSGAILGMTRKEIDKKFNQIVHFAGLREFIDTPVKRYSSGMQARLGFAVAAHMDPDILLIDEVLSVGDAVFRAKCLEHMKKLLTSNVTVVFVSHNMEIIRQLCEQAILLNKGEIIFYGNINEAITHYLLLLKDQGSENASEYKSAQILSFQTFQEGKVYNTYRNDKPLLFKVRYKILENLEEVSLTISCRSATGLWLFAYNNKKDNVHIPSCIGVHQVVLVLENLPVKSGDYDLSVTIYGKDQNSPLDSHFLKYKIFIKGKETEDLLLDISRTWKVEGE